MQQRQRPTQRIKGRSPHNLEPKMAIKSQGLRVAFIHIHPLAAAQQNGLLDQRPARTLPLIGWVDKQGLDHLSINQHKGQRIVRPVHRQPHGGRGQKGDDLGINGRPVRLAQEVMLGRHSRAPNRHGPLAILWSRGTQGKIGHGSTRRG